MADLEVLVTLVAPLTVTALTLLLWGLLVIIQSPRPYWRDTLNRSIAGLLTSLAGLLVLLALEALDVGGVNPWKARVVIGIAGLFALLGLPRTIVELRTALGRRPEGS